MNNQRKILISGTSSGLGKYLYKKIGTHKYDRKTQPSYYQKIKWDLIVHCGFYAGEDITKAIESIRHSYLISKLKSQKIIFISSLIVYENSSNTLENTKLYIKKNSSLYNKSKILSESFFNKKNMIILRVGTLIGKYMKKIIYIKSFITKILVFLLQKRACIHL